MPSTDNRRTIDSDDIEDHCIGPVELNTFADPKNQQSLHYNLDSGKLEWKWSIFGRIFR